MPMTAAPVITRSRYRGRSWDPLIRPLAVAALALCLLFNSRAVLAIDGVLIPNTVPLLLGLGAIAMAITVPRPETVIIPIAPTLLMLLLIASVGWSADPDNSILWLRSDMIVAVGVAALVLALPNRDVIAGLKLFVGVALAVTLLAVVVDPLARMHIDPTGEAPDLTGWHGWFIHKNTMAGFMVVALPTVMAFYRTRWARWTGYAVIVVLMIGSDSTTGRSALVVVAAVRVWVAFNRRLSSRGSVTFLVSTIALVALAIIAAVSSLATLADAAGKDLTFTGRTQIWSAVLNAWAERPILGYGIKGLFAVPLSSMSLQLMREIGFKAGHAHSGPLDVGLQLGLVGLIAVIGVLVGIYRASIRELRRSLSVPMFCLTVIVGITIMSVGESALLGPNIAVFFILRAMLLKTARANDLAEVARLDELRRGPQVVDATVGPGPAR